MFDRKNPILEHDNDGCLQLLLSLSTVLHMRRLRTISFWSISILLLAIILTSVGYSFVEALFVSTLFLPGALAFKFFIPGIPYKDRWTGIKNSVFLILGILVAEVLLFMIAHMYICRLREGASVFYVWPEQPPLLTNPVFIALILTVFAAGSHFFEMWLESRYPPDSMQFISFISDRKSVTLPLEEILYVESNDSVTTVVATGQRRFKNKTSISQWEANLAPHFMRIHRSYLVNKKAIDTVDVDILYIGDTQIPVSRKYKDAVRDYWAGRSTNCG